jgi:hypothetical protein
MPALLVCSFANFSGISSLAYVLGGAVHGFNLALVIRVMTGTQVWTTVNTRVYIGMMCAGALSGGHWRL